MLRYAIIMLSIFNLRNIDEQIKLFIEHNVFDTQFLEIEKTCLEKNRNKLN